MINLHEARKWFGHGRKTVRAVDGVTLTVHPGEIVAFLGPNGAGKTTTIDMILGLTQPSSGTVTLDGETPRRAIEAGKVGAVLQTGGLLRDLRVRETVEAIAALHGLGKARVDEAMERAHLGEIAQRRVSRCSGGEQQRLKFALALLPDPDVLVLDEPTAGMDVATRRDFWATMRDEARAGRTIIFATHYLEEAQEFAQRIVLIAHGRIVADGTVEEVQTMTSGRELAATFDTEITHVDSDPRLRDLAALGATGFVVNGPRVTMTAADSDAVALHLLRCGARDLTICVPTLESAFLALTQEH